MNMRILLTYVAPYDLTDERGQRRSGLSCQYCFFGEDGEAVASKTVNPSGASGWRQSKVSLPIDQMQNMISVPGVYDGEFDMRVGSDGKPTLILRDVRYVGTVNISLGD